MKQTNTILLIILVAVTGCKKSKQSTDDFITVDVTANYPKKELILQDFMDVEYIPLETANDFLTQGLVLAIGKDVIIVKNRINDGDIFIFDKTTGKGLKKINHRGQGPEEYVNATWITLDEDIGEMFVNDIISRRILIYDLDGKFKRSFSHKEGVLFVYMYNFDRENLLCYDGSFDYNNEGSMQPFLLISKQDGSITREIQIPYQEMLMVKNGEMFTGDIPDAYNPIISHFNSWLLVEPSSDTIYRYLPNHNMTPLIVRTPSSQSMDPKVFLFLNILSERYYFMEAVKKVNDLSTQQKFSSTYLLYNKRENALFEYTVYNDDYVDKKPISIKPSRPRSVSNEIATWKALEADQLVESYKKGELKGKLKEIAAKLDEEDNPVIMLIKHKK